jgi:hypothetical protein
MQKLANSTKKTTLRRALGPADPTLSEAKVVAPMCLTPMTKMIEQVGNGYEALKKRYARLEENIKIGALAQFSDEDDASDSEEIKRGRLPSMDDEAKKQARRDRRALERAFCAEGNLYGVLELEKFTWESTQSQIKKAYQKAALKYHPDKV